MPNQPVPPAESPPYLIAAIRDLVQWVNARFATANRMPNVAAAANLPSAVNFAFCAYYVRATAKPAWSDGTTWRYADGSAA